MEFDGYLAKNLLRRLDSSPKLNYTLRAKHSHKLLVDKPIWVIRIVLLPKKDLANAAPLLVTVFLAWYDKDNDGYYSAVTDLEPFLYCKAHLHKR